MQSGFLNPLITPLATFTAWANKLPSLQVKKYETRVLASKMGEERDWFSLT